jgi:hypothetical protein
LSVLEEIIAKTQTSTMEISERFRLSFKTKTYKKQLKGHAHHATIVFPASLLKGFGVISSKNTHLLHPFLYYRLLFQILFRFEFYYQTLYSLRNFINLN